jgi:hypothetical protein
MFGQQNCEADPPIISATKGRRSMPTFQARIIRQEVAITYVEGETIEMAKEKLRVWLENDENLRSLDWLTHSAGSAPEIVVMMEVAPVKEGEDGEGV